MQWLGQVSLKHLAAAQCGNELGQFSATDTNYDSSGIRPHYNMTAPQALTQRRVAAPSWHPRRSTPHYLAISRRSSSACRRRRPGRHWRSC